MSKKALFRLKRTGGLFAIETDRQATDGDAANYNHNENLALTQALRNGARGAYWDILRQLRNT